MTRIGLRLQEVRFRKKLTLEEISNATKIRVEFLEAIESGDFSKLPSSTYAYGFVRNYAKYLNVDPDQAIALYKREFDSEKNFDVLPKGFSKRENLSKKRIRVGRNALLILGVFLFVGFFIFFQYKDAIFNPPLSVESPKEGDVIASSEVQVKGKTDSSSVVYIENQPVSVDEAGNFQKTIIVFPGKAAIQIKSTNRFNRTSEILRRITVKPSSSE